MSGEFEVDVVRADLTAFRDLSPLAAALSDDERRRAEGYKMAESRDVFILARGLLRLELARRMDVAPDAIQFEVRPSGKPDVSPGAPSRLDCRFSVSHTGPHIAMAFARGVDVGIDIERLDRDVDPLHIARRYFTPWELFSLEATPAEARTRAFFAGWTRKEAIVKARGHTMSESLATLSVDLDPEESNPEYEDAESAATRPQCRLTAFEVRESNLIGAVALNSDLVPRLRFNVVSRSRFD